MEHAGTYAVEASLSVRVEGAEMELGSGHIMVPFVSKAAKDGTVLFDLGSVAGPLADFLRAVADGLEQAGDEGDAE